MKPSTHPYISLLISALIRVALLPMIFLLIGTYIETQFFYFQSPCGLDGLLSYAALIGLPLLAWALFSEWQMKRTEAYHKQTYARFRPIGPYKWIQNPLAAIMFIYYLGIGPVFGSLITGLLGAVIGFVIEIIYHESFRKKQMKTSYQEYKTYQQETPYLFPKFW